ncbi:hypothetical protein ABZ896_02570 [Streptomyces sp. NPDC047072]|uniref:hypothetical protein n=1 Tax=Streptomyces sp. NPDC047072 TaxID=3154809 RepID=UPI0033DA9046
MRVVVASDVPSHVYSHQREILAYLRQTADDLGITPRIVTGGPEEDRAADAVVLAAGQLDKLAWPASEGRLAGHSFRSPRT